MSDEQHLDLAARITTSNAIDDTLLQLQQAIANFPDIDTTRVAEIIAKLENKKLQILGDSEERMLAAMRIAKNIIEESNGC